MKNNAHIDTLLGIKSTYILEVFNKSFSDYFVPLRLTEEQLASKMISDNTDLKLSVGVFENQELIAFILHGFDRINNENVVYNGGTGVLPEKRGSGLTKEMYLYILPLLEKLSVDKVILEVITQNTKAIKSYKNSGFKISRELACFKGNFRCQKFNEEVKIKELLNYQWEQMESFWDIKPTWQNSKKAINRLKSEKLSLGAYFKNELIGYVIYNLNSKRIQQIAVNNKFRKKGIGSRLIAELTKRCGDSFFTIINVDKMGEHIIRFFNSMGFENYLEQLEMEIKIDKNTANNV